MANTPKKKWPETLLAFFAGVHINEKLKLKPKPIFGFQRDFIENHNRFGYSAYASLAWKKQSFCPLCDWVFIKYSRRFVTPS